MKHEYPSLSIVVNNYNYEQYLEEALESVFSQLYNQDEVIVVDDGSSDNSLAVLEGYQLEGKLTLIAQQNQGQMAAVVTGINAPRAKS
ncbi:MAG: glycosyltransferase family 2 protein [Haliea sp.]|nr:glycosyltransferase family 2 protein [Haliea sp.]